MIKWKKKNFRERSQLDNIFKIQKIFWRGTKWWKNKVDDFNDEENSEDNENKIDLLKNLLSLYFNYSKDFFEEIMNYYFKPIEKNLYNLLLENFDNKLQENDYIIN